MVSLAKRSEYLRQFDSDHYARAFVDFLIGKRVSAHELSGEGTANDLAVIAFRAIQENDQAGFSGVYKRISGRRPGPDSDWLYNDLLLYALAVGVVKFGSDAEWLKEALQTRITNTEGESELIARTLLDAVNGNFDSANNYGPLLIVVKHAVNVPLGTSQYVNSIYRQLTEHPFPPHESSFLNAVSLRAADAIILSKELGNLKRQLATDTFVETFRRKIRTLAFLSWLLLLALVVAGTTYFGYRYLTVPEKTQGVIEKILDLWPFLGVPSLLAIVASKQKIEVWLTRRFLKLFGYSTSDLPYDSE